MEKGLLKVNTTNMVQLKLIKGDRGEEYQIEKGHVEDEEMSRLKTMLAFPRKAHNVLTDILRNSCEMSIDGMAYEI